jgi:hypothetical protein
MDDLPNRPADFLGTAFARLGQMGPNPGDVHFGLVFRIAGPCPPLEELRNRVAARVERLPQLTRRLVARATVEWEHDPDFDIANHVHTLPRHTGVLSAQSILADAIDPGRPPWGLWVSEDDDSWKLYYLVHHARQDAAAALRTVTALLGDGTVASVSTGRPQGGGWPALLPIYPDLLRTRLPAPPVPRGAYGPARAMGHRVVDMALLKEVAERTGATVNQVHLAAMSDALDRWEPRPGASRRQVNTPIDVRLAGDADDDFANRIGFMRVALPCGGAPAGLLRNVVAAAGRRRLARYRRVWRDLVRNGRNDAAAWAMQRITDHTQVSMTLSSIRVASPLTLVDAPVREVAALPWLPPAHTCFAFLATYGEEARLSVLAPEGAPDPEALAALWSDAVHELHRVHAPEPTAAPAAR